MHKVDKNTIDDVVDTVEQSEDAAPAAHNNVSDTEDNHEVGSGLHFDDKPAKKSHKKKLIIISAAVLAFVTVVLLVPFLRYGLAGMVVSKKVTLTVIDSVNSKPISDAKVSLGRYDATSDAKGIATIDNVPVGEYTLTIEKKNYASYASSHVVTIVMPAKNTTRALKATGRTVMVTVTNLLSEKSVANAKVDIEGATAVSDDKGIANIVLPIRGDDQQGTVAADGYNVATITASTNAKNDQPVSVKLTPAGKVYFLSKRTGTINVMAANFDGSEQAVVLQGTGKELDNETSLLPSPDWKTLALIARRDADRAKLYVLSADNPQPKLIDSADASYEPVGWTSGKFYYKVRNTGNLFDVNNQQLVSYDVASGTRQVIDGTMGTGDSWYNYSAQQMSGAYIVGGRVVYMKYWQYGTAAASKNRPFEIMAINPVGNIRSVVKTIAADGDNYGDAKMRRPNSVVFRRGTDTNQVTYYEYLNGNVAIISMETADFYADHPTYQMSPSGERVLWQESRDGKNVLFVADKNLAGGRQISVGDYATYGWAGEDYVLYSKNRSELYIAPAGSELNGAHKISDYHKATVYPSYGWGSGGAS